MIKSLKIIEIVINYKALMDILNLIKRMVIMNSQRFAYIVKG